MKKLFDSVACEGDISAGAHKHETVGITYEFRDSHDLRPYVRITFSIPLVDGSKTGFELDIPRDDMVDLLNEVVDEWPEIVDFSPAHVRRGVKVLPTFC